MISEICKANYFETEEFKRIATAIKEDPTKKLRKIWEFCKIISTLEKLNLINPGKKGLGFAVGEEPLSSYFISRGCKITASDYVDPSSIWTGGNQVALTRDHVYKKDICSIDDFDKNLIFKHIDMNNIPDEELQGEYDFIWSSCAFEHIGGLMPGLNFVVNSLECLKPGGIAVHTTEYNCSSNEGTLESFDLSVYRKKDIEILEEMLIGKGKMYPMNYDQGDDPLDKIVDRHPYSKDIHIKFYLGGYDITSCLLIIQKL